MAAVVSKELMHGSRRQTLVQQVLTRFFQGKYQPNQRMTVQTLAKEWNVSATPVREALVELEGIGIVEIFPNRGAVLRNFGAKELREICQVRRILESEATRCACGHITPHELSRLEQIFSELSTAKRTVEWSETTQEWDDYLHELIYRTCGSDRLSHEINRYRVLYRTLRQVRHSKRQNVKDYKHMEENTEHLRIVQALADGDPEQAAQAMHDHLLQSAVGLERDLFQQEKT
ncbi:MAG: GntR family transcriptional regulator [Planctomycetota bacterium]|jgi:DNA-binding GntR family transcriptional regulator|uniref:GntR family transcriptional regulator n=1 Tax=uncultured Gimesia sp. TaxID=1678688 RepID=UPI00262417CE|nr:GntR family transcriptional regulator [uncultured Gimesia sp.]|tara:strand:- start:22244 stop:22939 length:696 start_codon:yes stop_codon:yes gene_type:complete